MPDARLCLILGMLTLFHHPFCPHSRFVRLVLEELGQAPRLVEERVWERREEFLVLNPAGTTPVLVEEGEPPVPGAAIIAEYLDETRGAELAERRLMPPEPGARVEVRRLTHWFNDKFFAEVTGPLVMERIYKRYMPAATGRRSARHRRDPCRADQYPLPSGLYRLAGAHPRLARRRQPDLCRSGRGGASVRRRLSGRCAVERRRDREDLVRAGEVAAVVPRAADRDAGRAAAGAELRRSRLLTPAELKAALAEAARAQGFDVVGVTRPDAIPLAAERLRTFLAEGAHGDMDWMAAKADRRGDPRAMWPDVRSVIMLGLNYGPRGDPLAILKARTRGAISVYAQGDDYHEVIKPRLKKLGRWLIEQAGGDIKVFVDTAAVMEKPLAEAAGLGWQGKHTNLVSREFGSWLFLGAIFTTLELAARRAGARSLRHLPRLPRRLPDGGFPGAVPARCAALHLLSHHRAQGRDPARTARR